MKNLIVTILLLSIILAIAGCATTYYGKFITASVNNEPIDEFQADGFVVLAFENQKTVGAEGWYWEFWVYYRNDIYIEYLLTAKIVSGTRTYYLEEKIKGEKPTTAASFTAKPNYERVKDRLISDLKDKGAPEFN